MKKSSSLFAALVLSLLASAAVHAAPVSYTIDPAHTFPSFEADHMGISVWRGKMNRNSGSVVYDKATGAGSVEITMELAGIDFGLDALNAWAVGEQFFDVKNFPRAVYKGRFGGALPAQLQGELRLHGITRPVTLTIHSLKCVPHPLHKRELCGADASGSFKRDEFGLAAGKDYGFKMDVDLRIQVEAVAEK